MFNQRSIFSSYLTNEERVATERIENLFRSGFLHEDDRAYYEKAYTTIYQKAIARCDGDSLVKKFKDIFEN